MPKVSKARMVPNHRTLPYPTVSTSQAMPSHQPTTPPESVAGRQSTVASWTTENDERLKQARQQGLNWQPIASVYFPDKTANACRKRHERLMEKSNAAGNWDTAKMEKLAMAYNDVREQMWQILADRVGEKWQTVESKCMEKGLKTLQSAGRTASRRDRERTANIDDFTGDFLGDHFGPRSRSRSHDNISDGFNDSAIGQDPDHPFSRQEDIPVPHSAGGISSSSRSFTPNLTFSKNSSTLPGFTPTITAAPQLPMVQSPTPTQQQTLPSFSAAFGMPSPFATSMPSISGVMRSPPVTTH